MEISEKAQAIHDKAILIDGHNDSIIEHWARGESMDLTPDLPTYQVDLRRMRGGGLTAMNSMMGGQTLEQSIELWDGLYEQVEAHPDDYLIVRSVQDIHRCKAEGKIGHIPQLESCRLFGNSLRVLVKYFDGLSREEIVKLNIPTGIPLIYELDDNLKKLRSYYLASAEEIEKAQRAVAEQGKAH